MTATNGVSPDATAGPFTVTVSPAPTAPSFTAASPPLTGTAGSAYTYTFAATGTPTPTFALGTGGPTWLSIDATSGAVSGTPPAGTTTFAYSVTATNGISPDATAGPFTVTVSSSTGTARADIDLDANTHEVKPGDTVTLHATVYGQNHKPKPTGSVSFTDNDTAVPGCTGLALPTSGKVTCKLSYLSTASSPHHIVASYSGDRTYEPGTATMTIRVTKIDTHLRLDASKNPVTAGQHLTYRATIDADHDRPPPTGTVTFTDDGVAIPGCTSITLNTTGPTTCSVNPTKGTHRIKAVYSGDGAYGSSSATLTETVKPAGSSSLPFRASRIEPEASLDA